MVTLCPFNPLLLYSFTPLLLYSVGVSSIEYRVSSIRGISYNQALLFFCLHAYKRKLLASHGVSLAKRLIVTLRYAFCVLCAGKEGTLSIPCKRNAHTKEKITTRLSVPSMRRKRRDTKSCAYKNQLLKAALAVCAAFSIPSFPAHRLIQKVPRRFEKSAPFIRSKSSCFLFRTPSFKR